VLRWGLGFSVAAALLIACGDDDDTGLGSQGSGKSKHVDAGSGDGGDKRDNDGGDAGGRPGKLPKDAAACVVTNTSAEIAVATVDKVDMLFMIDNSNSMREEQASLRAQFAHVIHVLTIGDRDNDGVSDFPPVKDLHLGVVTSDMGLLGIDGVDNCSGFGDDGILQHSPSPEVQGCQASYPSFLTYAAGKDDPNVTANDFACIGTVGTGGCGFEQQLEAPLKALWPSLDPMPNPDGSNRITFLGDANGQGILGHGDTDNIGFLRNDPSEGLSVIVVVVVTDEEDCSSSNTRHFTPPTFLDPNDPLASQPLNLRCFFNKTQQNGDELFKLERYINGFKALRPGNENLVVFAAITGVPPDLVDPAHVSAVDFGDQMQRDTFYASILNDPRMQEMIDPASMTTPGTGNLVPSCQTDRGKAYPPRRIVEVAHQFGANGIVQSICQSDFGPAMDAIVSVIQKQLGATCLPRTLARNRDGLVGCDVVWELPLPGQAPASTPTECGQAGFEFLLDPGASHANHSDRGGAICKVAQLAVKGDAGSRKYVSTETDGTKFSQGWYYDDFSDTATKQCTGPSKQLIAFTDSAKPPTGVSVKLECLTETIRIEPRTDVATNLEQPNIGDACDHVELNGQDLSGDEACYVKLNKPTKKWPDGIDKSMFCDPETNRCTQPCSTDADCLDKWSCDDSDATKAASGGKAICVAPSCSAGSKVASAAHVGDPCLAEPVPESGFDDREVYLGTSDDDDCGGGVCLVYHLSGDPSADCVATPAGSGKLCANPAEVEGRVYCSCRCSASDGYAQCACPSGFSCQDVLEQGGPDLAGGYCVKNGT
jgi:hypothetical protein